jgi:hypothetical protein
MITPARTPKVTTGEEQFIPTLDSTIVLKSNEIRNYVLSVDIDATNGYLRFYYSQRPLKPDPSSDGPLSMRVWTDCTIVIELDTSSIKNWEFRHVNAVTMGPSNYATPARYFNLVPAIVNNRCQSVQFNAQYLNMNDRNNHDPFNLYLYFDQEVPPGNPPSQLLIILDPDIQNPGDPTQMGGP